MNKYLIESSDDSPSQEELDLLQIILEPEASYPWNPAQPESEAFFTQLEHKFTFAELSLDDIEMRSQQLFSQLDRLWEITDPSVIEESSLLKKLLALLSEQFAPLVPQSWLNAIAQQAEILTDANHSHLSLETKLVECVQELLPNWLTEDLQVLARPYAWAMRSSEPPNLRAVDWTELSEIEQVRFTLAIAHFALSQVNISDHPSS